MSLHQQVAAQHRHMSTAKLLRGQIVGEQQHSLWKLQVRILNTDVTKQMTSHATAADNIADRWIRETLTKKLWAAVFNSRCWMECVCWRNTEVKQQKMLWPSSTFPPNVNAWLESSRKNVRFNNSCTNTQPDQHSSVNKRWTPWPAVFTVSGSFLHLNLNSTSVKWRQENQHFN